MGFRVKGLRGLGLGVEGFRVKGLRVLGFWGQGGLGFWGSGFRAGNEKIQGLGLKVYGWLQAQNSELKACHRGPPQFLEYGDVRKPQK